RVHMTGCILLYATFFDRCILRSFPTRRSSDLSTGSAATTKSGGLFGGSSFMKGMMLGGLAGLLFGGMFANMGAFGEIFGLLINIDRKSTRLNSSHVKISYAVFCLKKKSGNCST